MKSKSNGTNHAWAETEIGRVPTSWKLVSLREVGETRYGLGQPPQQADDGIPMIRATNIKRGRIVKNGLIRIKHEAIPESRNPYLKLGDIVVVRSGAYTGDVAMITKEWAGAVAGYDLVFSPSDLLTSEFCAFALLSQPVQEYFHGARARSAQPHLNRNQLENTCIPLPPLPEQEKIAGVLGLVQRAMEQQEQLIEKTNELKKTLLGQFFTKGLRGEPQNKTEIGPVPESWQVANLGEYLTEARYGLSAKGQDSGCYALLRMTNQRQGRITAANLQYIELDEGEFLKHQCKKGDILFNRTNSLELVGRTALFDLPGDFVFASYLIRLRTDAERLRPEFLNHYFNSEATQLRLKSIATRAVSQSNISATRLRGFSIPVPQTGEQDEIVSALNSVDAKLEVHRRKHAILMSLFRTLLHELMTAQVRVDQFDLPAMKA